MLILAINTASKESALALIEDGTVLGESSWMSNADESVKVLPGLQKLLADAGKEWEDVGEVFVVKGPGAYTSLRVGITIANSLAWSLKKKMRTTDVFNLWEHRIDPANRGDEHLIAIAAGRDVYQIEGDVTRYSTEEIDEKGLTCYGEIPDAPKPAQTFGEAVVELYDASEQVKQVEPFYTRPPQITVPKKA
jgi:tRNA threonylcarbamoyl adenosine modification protein YeaZ